MTQQTITINGTTYDAHTGLPVGKSTLSHAPKQPEQKQAKPSAHHSHEVHQLPQKSQTLNRRVVKKTAHVAKKSPQTHAAKKSPMITKFAPHPAGATKPRRIVSDFGPVPHPTVQKAHSRMAAKAPEPSVVAPIHQKPAAHPVAAAPKPAQVIKNEAISDAMHHAPSHHAAAHKKPEHKPVRKTSRTLSIASASIALLLLGGYFTYLNMPSLSVRVAAAQAGIDASYPSYRPDGYRIHGPVGYNQGEVSMKFASNAGPQNFTITQSKTNWDSSAVEENYVQPKWGDDKMVQIEQGLTIYTHDGNAVWVNDGILYTIQGDAPLSSSQIRNIATSL